MGYYSYLEVEATVKEEHISDFRGLLAEIKIKKSNKQADVWELELLEMISVDDEGNLCVYGDDWNAKWYNDHIWTLHISPFMEDGDFVFTGEEGEKSGYRFKNGKVYNLWWQRMMGKEIIFKKENK